MVLPRSQNPWPLCCPLNCRRRCDHAVTQMPAGPVIPDPPLHLAVKSFFAGPRAQRAARLNVASSTPNARPCRRRQMRGRRMQTGPNVKG
eukprot:1526188-Lingulodinium_polyedra.AAC.1